MIGQLNKQQLEIMRLVVWEKITRSDEYRAEYLDVINPSIKEGLAAHMEKYNAFVEKWNLPTPLHPDWSWEDIAKYKDNWKWFMGHSIELMAYPSISKRLLKKIAKRLSVELPNLKKEFIDKLPNKMANKRFSRKTWEYGYKAWDLVKDNDFSVEDAALTLRKSPQTVYRWYNEIGKHILGDSFRGKKQKRESHVFYTGSQTNYAYVEKRAMERRIEERNWKALPLQEQVRLQKQYLEANGVTTYPAKVAKGAMPRPKAVNREPLEYRATTGRYTLVMKSWEKSLPPEIDLEKIRIISNRLKALGIIPPDCRASCLLCQVDGIWAFVDSDQFRAALERLGIKHKWLEIVGRFAFPMNTPRLYENYLCKEGSFSSKDSKKFVKEGTNES